MTLISSNIKEKIIVNLNEIINIQDITWNNLDKEIKFKVIHNLCNILKSNISDIQNTTNNINMNNNTSLNIPLKNLRPKKLIQFCGINKQTNSETYNQFRKNILEVNREFRCEYNSKNNYHCFAHLSKNKYNILLNNYNQHIYLFLLNNIKIINYKNFYKNLLGTNEKKIISSDVILNNNLNNDSNKKISNKFNNNIKIKQINYRENFLDIEFNNNVIVQLELYLTSEKITNNIPAKYKINLINIF